MIYRNTFKIWIGDRRSFFVLSPQGHYFNTFHPDHAYFVRWGKEENPPTNVPIYAPELPLSKNITREIKIIHKTTLIEGYKITLIPTHHSKNVKSQAYLVVKDGKSFLYTGDLVWIDKEFHSQFEKVDLVITDGSFLRKGGLIRKDQETEKLFGHNGIPNLINLFKAHTKKILFMHFGAWFYENTKLSRQKLEVLGRANQVEIIVGYEGQEIIL